jgi:hypothetical protein
MLCIVLLEGNFRRSDGLIGRDVSFSCGMFSRAYQQSPPSSNRDPRAAFMVLVSLARSGHRSAYQQDASLFTRLTESPKKQDVLDLPFYLPIHSIDVRVLFAQITTENHFVLLINDIFQNDLPVPRPGFET